MPMLEVYTRKKLDEATKRSLAEDLTRAVVEIETDEDSERARRSTWVLFPHLDAGDWAVGGRFDDRYADGQGVALVRFSVFEGVLDPQRVERTVKDITSMLRAALGTQDSEGRGNGIWIQILEYPDGRWGSRGAPQSVHDVARLLWKSPLDPRRTATLDALVTAKKKLKEYFGFPH